MQLTEGEKGNYKGYIENSLEYKSIISDNYNKGRYEGEANKEQYADEKAKEKQLSMAKKCLEDGMSITKTAKLTCLTEDEIRNITV